MDPITSAILAVIPAVAAETAKSAVKDAYEGLKAVIVRKWGETAPIAKAIAAIEEDPTSEARAALLQEKVAAARAAEHPEVATALSRLLDEMKATGSLEGNSNIHVQITGGRVGIAAAKEVRIANFSLGQLGEK